MKSQLDVGIVFVCTLGVTVLLFVCYPVPCFSVSTFSVWLFTVEDEDLEEGTRVQIKCCDNAGKVFQHHCDRQVAIFCRNGYAYLRQTSTERVLKPLLFPEELLRDKSLEAGVNSFAFCNNSVFFVLQGDLFRFHYPSGNYSKSFLGGDVTYVETSCYCFYKYNLKNPLDEFIIAWNGLVNLTHLNFHLSQDGGINFKRKKIVDAKGFIQNAHFLHSHGCIGFLVRTRSQMAKFFYYSYIHDAVSDGLKGLDQSYLGNLSSVSVGSGDSEILLWDDERLRYSANGGQAFLPVHEIVLSDILVNYNYSCDKRPTQVLSEASDTFVVRNSKGEVYFGKAGITPSLLKVTGLSVLEDSAISLSDEVNIVVWSLQFPGGSSSPNQSVVASSSVLYPLEKYSPSCKHQSLTIIQSQPLYYLDIGMTMVLEVNHLPNPWVEDKFIVSVENPDIISTHTNVTFGDEVDKGVRETNLEVTVGLVASQLPDGQRESARGMSNVKISILDPNPACMADTSKTIRIVAGCPSFIQIRVRRTVEVTECENMKFHQYTIPRDVYDPHHLQGSGPNSDWGDLEVTYDYWKLGCPHPVYYGFLYKPIIELYENDVFKEVIEADFVLTEAHGMYNYGYTETAATAGCKRSPQSWISMLTNQPTPDPHTAWTRKNYVSCLSYDEQGEEFDSSQSYEVLNNNTANGIKFSQYNGIYVFNVSILDPDYSFCQLRTQFAIEVFGAFPKSSLPALRIMLITCGVGLLGLISFYVIDISYLRETEEEQGDKRRDSFPY